MSDVYNGMPITDELVENSKYLFGTLPAYPVFMTLGIFAVIIASIIKFRIKNIPLKELQIGIYIVVPLGILGGSLFGKILSYENINWKIWEYFFFWEPGMNLYGALLFGGIGGFLYFNHVKKERKISILVYADCIVPHVLLGQAIGRWGNLFNHEILGKPMEDPEKFKWLPDFIFNRLFYVYDPSTGVMEESVLLRTPLFLYESLGNLFLWILIVFIIANIGRWFSKKPWNFETNAYPYIWNKNLRSISEENLVGWQTQKEITYSKTKENKLKMNLWNLWNKAYYLREVDINESNKIVEKMNLRSQQRLIAQNNYKNLSKKINNEIEKEKQKLIRSKISKRDFGINKKLILKSYKNDLKELRHNSNPFLELWNRDSSELYKLHNPNNYFIIHSGVVSSCWIVCYTLLRMILEHQRNIGELMVKWSWTWDYILLSSILLFGILCLVFTQFVVPKKWRKEEWLYEKSY